jgi:hypothetical protein
VVIALRRCFKNLEQCPFSVEERQNTAFVSMPFKRELQDVYISGIKKALEEMGWTCHRADEKFDTPEIICTICKNTQEANLIFADLTGKNPNVFLEVGLAFGLQKYVVLLSQNSEDIPFDAKTFRTIIYDSHELSDLRQKIRTTLKNIKIVPSLPKESPFEKRYIESKRIKEPQSEPLMEIFIGSTYENINWLPPTEVTNVQLMRCMPSISSDEVIPRRGFFEFKSRLPGVFLRVDSDGFFHAVIPFLYDSYKQEYYLDSIVRDIAEVLFFIVRVMKIKEVKMEQTLRIDLHGTKGRKMSLFSGSFFHREWAFSEEQDYISYQKTFNPTEKWFSFFKLLCEIYKDICVDLGVSNISDEEVTNIVTETVRSMQSLRTSCSPSGLQALSFKEIIGKPDN